MKCTSLFFPILQCPFSYCGCTSTVCTDRHKGYQLHFRYLWPDALVWKLKTWRQLQKMTDFLSCHTGINCKGHDYYSYWESQFTSLLTNLMISTYIRNGADVNQGKPFYTNHLCSVQLIQLTNKYKRLMPVYDQPLRIITHRYTVIWEEIPRR